MTSEQRICAYCGEPFTPRSQPGRREQRYCSRRCGIAVARAARTTTGAIPWRDRFWRFVPEQREPGACWEWQGNRRPAGYGLLMLTKTPYRLILAHRASWLIHHGAIADGLKVCHRCDNPPCVNPAHLFLGTQVDNIADMDRKGRRRRLSGTEVGTAKFSDETIAEVKRLLGEGLTPTPISHLTGVSVAHVKSIRSGRARRDS